MAALVPSAVAEIIYRYTANNQICMTVLHYVFESGTTTYDPIDATNSLLGKVNDPGTNNLLTRLADCQSNEVSYLDVSVQLIWPTRYLKFKSPLTKVGTAGTPCTAQNVAAVITKQTIFSGRDRVGSLHVGGVATQDYNGGLLAALMKTKMNFLATAMLDEIVDAGAGITWKPCLANKSPIVGTDPPKFRYSGFTVLYSTIVQPELRVMRRRTVGLGI